MPPMSGFCMAIPPARFGPELGHNVRAHLGSSRGAVVVEREAMARARALIARWAMSEAGARRGARSRVAHRVDVQLHGYAGLGELLCVSDRFVPEAVRVTDLDIAGARPTKSRQYSKSWLKMTGVRACKTRAYPAHGPTPAIRSMAM
jgi:hypothetical protein